MVTTRTLMLAASLGVAAACAENAEPPASGASPTPAPDAPPPPSATGTPTNTPARPYPPGPYGALVGDTIADFTMMGYRMAPDARDSSRLPLEPLRLSEMRAARPDCTCMVIQLVGAGTCLPSRESELVLSEAVIADPSLCVVEIIDHNLDLSTPDNVEQNLQPPPTRADLDAVTLESRQPYPVGLRTTSSIASLAAQWIIGTPTQWIVRAADMRVVEVVMGADARKGSGFVKWAKNACAEPQRMPSKMLDDVDASRVVVAGDRLVASTRDRGLVTVPLAGGAPTTLVAASAHPDAIVVDGDTVVFASREASPNAIAGVPMAGGASTTLTTAASGFASIALADDQVYFARTDGVIGSVPRAGGTPVTLVTDEVDPRSLVVSGDALAWIASTGDVRRAARTGGSATTLAARSAFGDALPVELTAYAGLVVRGVRPIGGIGVGKLFHVGEDGTVGTWLDPSGNPIAATIAKDGSLSYALGDARGASFLFHGESQGAPVPGLMLTGGALRVTSIAAAAPFAYWATAPGDGSRGTIWRIPL